MMDAYDDLMKFLDEGETVEAIIFGGWDGDYPRDDGWRLDWDEPDPPFVPFDQRGKVLTPNEARPIMAGWSLYGEWKGYAVTIYTNRRVILVARHNGTKTLYSRSRNPIAHLPDMPGG